MFDQSVCGLSYIVRDWEGIQKFCPKKFVYFVLIYNFCLCCQWKFDLPEEFPLCQVTATDNLSKAIEYIVSGQVVGHTAFWVL